MEIIKHTCILLFSVALVIVIHNFSYEYTLRLTYLVILLAIVTLAVTLITGNTRWLTVLGFNFQPSECAKLSMLLYAAWQLDWGRQSPEKMKRAFWNVLVLTAVFCGLIVTKNLSTALIICLFTYVMFFIGGIPARYMIRLTIVALIAGAVLYIMLLYIPSMPLIGRWHIWHERVTTEKIDVRDEAYRINDGNRQQHYAKIAVSEGVGFGVFPGNSTQRDFLPDAYNDFIYAIIIEDMGWIGAIMMPLLYIILMVRCARISRKCDRAAPMLLMLGAAFLIALQAFINMGVSVGLFPVTGQPMPLVSKGGTSQVITGIYFGIILSVSRFGTVKNDHIVLEQEQKEDEIYQEQHNGTDNGQAG